jgi:poly-gamma-glutamate capsule biosynthesis protein CapA/YwtB (metallophosphatase superfamily)
MNLAMVGDVMLGRLVNEVLKERPPEYPWGDTLPLLRGADFRLCNLECAISDDGEPWSASPKEFHFRSDAKNVGVLLAAKMDAVSLANNHALDFGYDALLETLEILDKAGIAHAGAGRTLKDAERAAALEVLGTKIAIIAFTDNEPGWEATSRSPGTFYVPVDLEDKRAARLLELVKETKKKADLLIVSAHWGPNWGYEPPPRHVPFAHAVVDAGADVVFGHSAHVFRGVEIYRSRPIIYCTGDFVDDYAVGRVERNDESFVFVLETARHGPLGLRLYPVRIESCQVSLATGAAGRAIGEKMRRLCAGFETSSAWGIQGHLDVRIGNANSRGRPR